MHDSNQDVSEGGTTVLFLTPVLSQPRFHKRIRGLAAHGIKPVILSFQRDYYEGDVAAGTILLGRVDHGSYLRRLGPLLRAMSAVRSRAVSADAVYAFGLDMLLLSWLALLGTKRSTSLVYEVADIRGVLLGGGVFSRSLRTLERFLLSYTDLLVVTSPDYLDKYYRHILRAPLPKSLVVENKLEPMPELNETPCPVTAKAFGGANIITIGYFGLIRCKKSVEFLRRLVDRYPCKYRIIIRGTEFGIGDPFAALVGSSSVEYGGAFRSPKDLREMYSGVDIVWAAHDPSSQNQVWARKNRFYEACFFGKPMIGQEGTADGSQIEGLGLGLTIDLNDDERSFDLLASIDEEDLKRWTANAMALPSTLYTYTDEHMQILQVLGLKPASSRAGRKIPDSQPNC